MISRIEENAYRVIMPTRSYTSDGSPGLLSLVPPRIPQNDVPMVVAIDSYTCRATERYHGLCATGSVRGRRVPKHMRLGSAQQNRGFRI